MPTEDASTLVEDASTGEDAKERAMKNADQAAYVESMYSQYAAADANEKRWGKGKRTMLAVAAVGCGVGVATGKLLARRMGTRTHAGQTHTRARRTRRPWRPDAGTPAPRARAPAPRHVHVHVYAMRAQASESGCAAPSCARRRCMCCACWSRRRRHSLRRPCLPTSWLGRRRALGKEERLVVGRVAPRMRTRTSLDHSIWTTACVANATPACVSHRALRYTILRHTGVAPPMRCDAPHRAMRCAAAALPVGATQSETRHRGQLL